jgi:hypothetical protein
MLGFVFTKKRPGYTHFFSYLLVLNPIAGSYSIVLPDLVPAAKKNVQI